MRSSPRKDGSCNASLTDHLSRVCTQHHMESVRNHAGPRPAMASHSGLRRDGRAGIPRPAPHRRHALSGVARKDHYPMISSPLKRHRTRKMTVATTLFQRRRRVDGRDDSCRESRSSSGNPHRKVLSFALWLHQGVFQWHTESFLHMWRWALFVRGECSNDGHLCTGKMDIDRRGRR